MAVRFYPMQIPALNGLRAISILCVLGAHMLPLGPKVLRLNETAGAMGMALFFGLSGFLITLHLASGQAVLDFAVRRLTRILPLSYLYLTTVLLVFEYQPLAFFIDLFFIQNYVALGLTPLTGHFWSLCVEVQFYLAIGVVVAMLGRQALWLVVPACLVVLGIRVAHGATINIQTHLRVDEILVGAVVALLYHRGFLTHRLSASWLLIAGAFWVLCSSPFMGPLQYLRPYASGILLAITIMLESPPILKVLESRAAAYVAAISYALYVVHPATIYGWMNEGSAQERYLLKRPLSFLATFVLAHLSTYHWERPWTQWGKRLTQPRPIVESASPRQSKT